MMITIKLTTEQFELISDLANEEYARTLDKKQYIPQGYADQVKELIEKIMAERPLGGA